MNAANLDTTNMLLGIMAAVSVLEALLLVGLGVMAYRLYGQALRTIRELEERQIAPLVARVNATMTRVDAILGDLRDVTSRVNTRTERVDAAIRHTVDRVDDTASRVRSSVSSQLLRVFALIQGARAAIDEFFQTERRPSSGAPKHA